MQYLLRYLLITLVLISGACAQDPEISSTERLKNDQEAVSGRYARFERLLSQMADILRHEDPERAELLRRAISKGREQAISSELDVIARKLGEGDYGAAREIQTDVETGLLQVLKLLQSEDRRSAVEKERERLNNILKGIRNTISEERAARGAALNSNAPSNAAPAQQKALKSADGLLDEISEHDDQGQDAETSAENGGKSGSKSGESSSSEDDSSEKKGERPGESESSSGDESKGNMRSSDDPSESDGESSDRGSEEGETKNSDNPDGNASGDGKENSSDSKSENKEQGSESESSSESSDQNQSQQSGGGNEQSQESQSESSSDQQRQSGQPNQEPQENDAQQTPGRPQLEQARNLMQEALEQLKKQERDEAVDKQDEALAELQKAEKELEEQLRQLREEEKEMILAALEARFQRLLALQVEINENTVDLAATPRDQWLDNAVSRCRDISQQQAELTRECSQTTALLLEDGTSVSILVSMEDIEADMGTVTDRLRDTKVFALTQSIQTDIVEALEELIKATQQEMEQMKEQQSMPQQQQSQNGEKPPLVELMAEIRVLRSLQLRVNRRTRQVDELLEAPAADDVEALNAQLQELTFRQQRLRESAVELSKQMKR